MPKRKKNLREPRRSTRRTAWRDVKQRFLILCEGKVTEREYFRDFNREVRGILVEVARDYGRDPEYLVKKAIAKRKAAEVDARRQGDDNLRYDQVWCVFDVDAHESFPAACRLAAENGILTAISNPCFELWALLHFQDQRAHIAGKGVTAALCMFLPTYEKRLRFDALEPHRPVATERARGLDERHERDGTPDGNPSTGVWKLTEAIETEAQRFRAQGSAR